MINPYKLDRIASIYKKVPSGSASGVVSSSLQSVLSNIWIAKETPSTRTLLQGAREGASIEDVFVMRFTLSVALGMVLVSGGVSYDIEKVVELDRRRYLRLFCKETKTSSGT